MTARRYTYFWCAIYVTQGGKREVLSNTQNILADGSLDSIPQGIPIHTFQNVIYTANVSVGTPPQPFALAIDTLNNDLLVPSVNCNTFCADPTNRYNSSVSATYEPNGSYHNVQWADVNYDGFLSRDTIHLGNEQVTHKLFEEWTAALYATIGGFDTGYDGVIGLAPPWKSSDEGIPNILSAMQSKNLLAEPVFSLRLPHSTDEVGELLIGATNPSLYEGELTKLPLAPPSDSDSHLFSGYWTVPASSITFSSPHPLHFSLPNTSYAILDSASPWMILPSELARNITAAIGAVEGPAWFNSVPCSRRPYLPDLTFELHGHNFTITAFEYTVEISAWKAAGLVCLSTIWPADEFGIPSGGDTIVLGNAFLRSWYSVFDFGSREVGFAKLKR